MTNESQAFDQWCIVELFGHVTLAGRVTEQTIGGCAFLRLDVPKVDDQPEFTKLLGQGAIYSVTPVSEEIARRAIVRIQARPVSVLYLPEPSPRSDSGPTYSTNPNSDDPYSREGYDGDDDDGDDDL